MRENSLTDIASALEEGMTIRWLKKKTNIYDIKRYFKTSADPTLKTLRKIVDVTGIPLKRFIKDYIPLKEAPNWIGEAKPPVDENGELLFYTDVRGVIGSTMNHSELARLSNKSPQLIQIYVTKNKFYRRDPSLVTLKKFSDATGIPIKDFIVDYIPEKLSEQALRKLRYKAELV